MDKIFIKHAFIAPEIEKGWINNEPALKRLVPDYY